jgi:hypothetical protein
MVLFLDCGEDGYEEVSPRQSGKQVAARMAAAAGPDTRLYSVRYFEHHGAVLPRPHPHARGTMRTSSSRAS